jgi:hypothetical protein
VRRRSQKRPSMASTLCKSASVAQFSNHLNNKSRIWGCTMHPPRWATYPHSRLWQAYEIPGPLYVSPTIALCFSCMEHHRVCLLTIPLHEYEEKKIKVTVYSTLPEIKIYQATQMHS